MNNFQTDKKPFCYFTVNNYTTHTNLQINLVTPCTNACWSCFRHTTPPYGQPFYSIYELLTFIQHNNIHQIVISSLGEPTLSKEYENLIEQTSKYVKKIVLVTNGTTSSFKILKLTDKVSTVSISLHGDLITHSCTTRNIQSFNSLIKFKQELRKMKNLEVVSSTLLTRELLGRESQYLALLSSSDLIRPSRMLFPIQIQSVETYLNIPTYVETSLILKRFAALNTELSQSQEDRHIPQCTTHFNNSLNLNVQRYLKNWMLEYCEKYCEKNNICSGIHSDSIQYRDTENLNDEIRFINSQEFQKNIVEDSFNQKDLRIPCLTYEHLMLQALRTLFNDACLFIHPIESYFNEYSYLKMHEQCMSCAKRTDCDVQMHTVKKFMHLPQTQKFYKTQFLYEVLKQQKTQMKDYYMFLLSKYSRNVVPLTENQKLLVDFV